MKAAVPDVRTELEWDMPVFMGRGMLCYLRAHTGYVRFGFTDYANELDDPDRRLGGSGQQGLPVKVASTDDIDRPLFTRWLKRVAELDARR